MRIFNIFKELVNKKDKSEQEQRRMKFLFIESILAFISLFMSILNIVSHKDLLLAATLFSFVASLTNVFLLLRNTNNITLPGIIFTINITILLSYFIIFGGTEGFSTIWILLIPTCAPYAFGLKKGTILTLGFFFELILFFYTPLKDIVLQTKDYTNSFLIRFPILYISFFLVSFYLEINRLKMHTELDLIKKVMEEQLLHDQLTSLYNRNGFQKQIEQYLNNKNEEEFFGVLILDIDYFKTINDTYGHHVGDIVLIEMAKRISQIDDSSVFACRWGGEEFGVFAKAKSSEELFLLSEKIRVDISQPIYVDSLKLYITVSLGGVSTSELSFESFAKFVNIADERLYIAKNNGRNRSICQEADTNKSLIQ